MAAPIAKQISTLLDIANLAIELVDADNAVLTAKDELNVAYNRHKGRNGIEHVTRDTPEWDLMIVITKPEFLAAEKAKRRAYNVKRRLRNAVARVQFA